MPSLIPFLSSLGVEITMRGGQIIISVVNRLG